MSREIHVFADWEELGQPRRIGLLRSMCVSNTDGHLRNHGFILGPSGWRLSPAYDLNPSPYGRGLSLAVSDTDNSLSLDLALEVCEFFRIRKDYGRDIINRVTSSVRNWRHYAKSLGIARGEQDRMSPAFSVTENWQLEH